MFHRIKQATSIFVFFITASCAGFHLGPNAVPGEAETGLAVYYSNSLHGNRTASGEVYDKDRLTAAHKSLPFGTIVRVVSLKNRRTVEVRINDRGPFGDADRVIDLSYSAAERLDMLTAGVITVQVEVVSVPEQKTNPV